VLIFNFYLFELSLELNKYWVTIFKLTSEIVNQNWDDSFSKSIPPPITEQWHDQREITIEDVSIWEQIYRQSGNFGIYAAYSPYTEFYIIVYELFLNTKQGILTYKGDDAPSLVYNKALELGIDLKTIIEYQ
jgi:hypothetical protein